MEALPFQAPRDCPLSLKEESGARQDKSTTSVKKISREKRGQRHCSRAQQHPSQAQSRPDSSMALLGSGNGAA